MSSTDRIPRWPRPTTRIRAGVAPMVRAFLGEMQSRIPRSFLRYGSARWHTVGVPVGLVSILLLVYGLGVVALFTTGRVGLVLAITLLVVPVTAALAVVRPEWILLVVVLIPPSLMGLVPPTQMTAVLLVTLFGFLLRGRLHLGLRTGIYPLVGIIAMAIAMKADTPADATAAANTILSHLVYYTLLMLAAFQATANGRLRVDSFVDALILGAVVTAILQPFVTVYTTLRSIAGAPFRGVRSRISRRWPSAYPMFAIRSPLVGVESTRWVPKRRVLGRYISRVGAHHVDRHSLPLSLVLRWTGKKSF